MSGKQIKLLLADGTPGGLTTAQITNWTGHVLSARRSDHADLLERDQSQRTGVYFFSATTKPPLVTLAATHRRGRRRRRPASLPPARQVVLGPSRRHHVEGPQSHQVTRSLPRVPLISLATQSGRVTLENGTATPVPALPK